MEYVYAALLIHSAGKKVTEEGIAAVIKAAGMDVDSVRAKALVSALEGVNIEEAISKSSFAVTPAQAAPATPAAAAIEAPKEEKEKEKDKSEESGMEGLGALFG